MEKKYVYLFKEGNANMKELLGGKGANLAEMTSLGMPIPQGFTITTESCNKYYDDDEQISKEILQQIDSALLYLEEQTGKKLGSKEKPLLVSVRSGARASMPGMMDTVLNLGMNDETVKTFAEKNRRFAYDSYRRFIQMYSDVVKEVPKKLFEDAIDTKKYQRNLKLDTDMDANDLEDLVKVFKGIYSNYLHEEFPQDTKLQLIEAIKAVFRSWNNPRAITYRKLNDIPSSWGTAVNVQAMVFGNMGEDCGTGVAFSRNPVTGEKGVWGEFLMNAQGEDVVAGIRTPQSIDTLKYINPEAYNDFLKFADRLEKHYKDMQDMEFTIEHGKLYMLQTRNGKRTAQAALKIAVDLVAEGMIDEKEAVLRVEPDQLNQLLHPNFDQKKLKSAKPVAKGLPASPGAATGKVVFTAQKAQELANAGEKELVLVRLETSPEDIEGMVVCKGILTVRGGMTSHAAVVARGMGTCCVAGCGELSVNEEEKVFYTKDGTSYHEGDYISLDGSTGNVYGEKIDTVEASVSGDFAKLMSWADSIRRLDVRTNADNPRDAKKAREFGAQGIGLCRTEHMFFEADRIAAIREMIVSKTSEQRELALNKILPMQRSDFEGLYKVMSGYPVVIRLLDPPLHEFLPHDDEEISALAKDMNMGFDELKSIVVNLHEFNPMMGHRGCRLSITYPEIAVMQTKAIIQAAINVKKEGYKVKPEIMVPLVGEVKELKYVKNIITETADKLIKESGLDIKYYVGTMIEIPRACLVADEIAKEAEFFSFGTNDLTQLTYGFSRDDAGKFLKFYYDKKIFEFDPFQKVDQIGVGKLMKMAIQDAKRTRPSIELGICGEHGGNPPTIEFCHNIGLTYVSCSPFRVPIARLAAAQAAVKEERGK
ncbi:MAG TPA: pyruvate, phosphate dikinase [Clostridiaceae bacterium]|nr:pyruvate, phosphate dikinase [Clostridiaceae bacterium]